MLGRERTPLALFEMTSGDFKRETESGYEIRLYWENHRFDARFGPHCACDLEANA